MFSRASPRRSDLPFKPSSASSQQESLAENWNEVYKLENQSGDNMAPKKPKIPEADVVLTLDFDQNSDVNEEEYPQEM